MQKKVNPWVSRLFWLAFAIAVIVYLSMLKIPLAAELEDAWYGSELEHPQMVPNPLPRPAPEITPAIAVDEYKEAEFYEVEDVETGHVSGGYFGGSLSAAMGETRLGKTDNGGAFSIFGGYIFSPYLAAGGRLDGYGFEDQSIDYYGGGAFIEGTASMPRNARAFGYVTLGLGYVDIEADNGAFDESDGSGAVSLEAGVNWNIGSLEANTLELGPMARYTYVKDLFGEKVDVYQLGVRIGWNGAK